MTDSIHNVNLHVPLAERVRPNSIDEYVGQAHLLGNKGVIKKYLAQKFLPSCIFWGPPGVGKTTLARLISKSLQRPFYSLSAVESSVKDIREIIEKTKKKDVFTPLAPPVLFIDEIHRFNKAQQDALLSAVESGAITLIGATTENPSFEVISALLSRCQVYVLKSLQEQELLKILQDAIQKDVFLRNKIIQVNETEAMLAFSAGDARKLLNILEMVVSNQTEKNVIITNELVKEIVQQQLAMYDKSGDIHYDVISAFIKSIRGSDPNASVYWLARMVLAGEDPKFIARRLIILASEDIGNANPTALIMANNCFQAVQVVGYPECEIILSQTVIYLATSVKSNASYMAIKNAKKMAEENINLPVPLHLKNAPTSLMKKLGYGKEYKYSHAFEGNFIQQQYLPDKIKGSIFYEPGANTKEEEIKKKLHTLWKGIYNY